MQYLFGIITNRGGLPATDIEGLKIGLVLLQDQHIGLDDILNMCKVAGLLPIFVDNQRLTAQGSAAEYTTCTPNSGYKVIGERLG